MFFFVYKNLNMATGKKEMRGVQKVFLRYVVFGLEMESVGFS